MLLLLAAAVPARTADTVAPDSASPPVRRQADLPASVLEHYVGYYEVSAGLVLTITRQGEQLYAQLTGQQVAAIYAETVASFYYKVADARIDFIPDPPTQINALVLHQAGDDLVAPRIDAGQAQRLQAATNGRAQDQAPAPASAPAAAQLLTGLAAGAPDYSRMTPELASALRQQLPQLQDLLGRLGPVRSMRFIGVGGQGWDLYLVTHDHGTSELRIRLNSSGAVAGALVSFRAMNTPADQSPTQRRRRFRLPLKVIAVSWKDLLETMGPALILCVVAVLVAVHFVRPAPPSSLTISTGPAGSSFHTVAEQYQKILKRNGIDLKILESAGSIENLNRLTDTSSGVDVALVQSGISGSGDISDLVSLGSMFYQPVIIFYRGHEPLHRLSQLDGHRIAIGAEGSGTRYLALAMLKGNDIDVQNGKTRVLDLEGESARSALLNGSVDAIFLSSDSASPTTIREMLHTPGIQLFTFEQADAYVRRFSYLSKLQLPAGAFDLGENLPPTPINMLAPTVEMLSHSDLHPALTDLLIEAAIETHGRATLLQNAGQFPTTSIHSFPISTEASRYYKSGRSFAYRYLPFWLASLMTRALVVIVPIFVVVIPALRYVPQLYNWRVRSRIYRRYGELMAIEREALSDPSPDRRAVLLERVDEIERASIAVKMPGSHGESLYRLRELLHFVRGRLSNPSAVATPPPALGEDD